MKRRKVGIGGLRQRRLRKADCRGAGTSRREAGIGEALDGKAVIGRRAEGLLHGEQGRIFLCRRYRGKAEVLFKSVGVAFGQSRKRIGNRSGQATPVSSESTTLFPVALANLRDLPVPLIQDSRYCCVD